MAGIWLYNGHFIIYGDATNAKTFSREYASLSPVNAMGISNGMITRLGDWQELQKEVHSADTCINLEGKTVIPGFFDAHIHIWKVGDLLTESLDLRGSASLAEVQEKLKDFSLKNPHLRWVRARGFNEALFNEPKLPSAADIDGIIPNKPVFLQRTCAHIAVVNSCALGLAHIEAHTPNPYGGIIEKDTDGIPTGRLYETAMGLVIKHFPKFTPEDYERMILAACYQLLQNGITCATDPAVHPELLEVYRRLEKEKKLPIRVCAIPILLGDGEEKPYPLPQKYISPFLRIDTVKFFADGGLSGKTASLKRPYKNDSSQGVLRLDSEYFYALAKKAQEAGFQIATHAIGDQAIDLVLEVYEKLHKTYPLLRNRIEHGGLLSPAQLKKCNQLGIHIVSQPVFLKELGKNFRTYLDDEYLKICYPYRSVINAGINLSFSTDAPVVKNVSPLSCIADAVERKDAEGIGIAPDERISPAEALYCYTQGSADASNMGSFYGSLAIGKKADLVVLAGNILNKTGNDIKDTPIEAVWIDGVPVSIPQHL